MRIKINKHKKIFNQNKIRNNVNKIFLIRINKNFYKQNNKKIQMSQLTNNILMIFQINFLIK